MTKIIFRYGLYASLLMIGIFFIALKFAERGGYFMQEVIGYGTMILSMLFVYFGIRQYRDSVNGGSLTFGQGLKVGVLIVLIPAVLFGFFDVFYTSVVNPTFYTDYSAHQLEKMRASLPPETFAVKSEEMKKQMEMFRDNPALQFGLMSVTVFLIGFIISIISALILRRNPSHQSPSK